LAPSHETQHADGDTVKIGVRVGPGLLLEKMKLIGRKGDHQRKPTTRPGPVA